jgi:endonuclease G
MADIPQEVIQRHDRVASKIKKTQYDVSVGRSPRAETSARRRLHAEREELKRLTEHAVEATTGDVIAATQERTIDTHDILLLNFFCSGLIASRAVGRIRIAGGLEKATGFLVSPTLVMTNEHVFRRPEDAAAAEIDFEEFDILGDHQTVTCVFDPDRFYFRHEGLDIAVVALEDTEHAREATEGLGWHPMIGGEGKILIGDPINLIQYPGGMHKSVVLHNSNLMHLENGTDLDSFCWYTSDTEKGSSGSPVFNNRWEVVAVHHRSIPKRNGDGTIVDAADQPMTDAEYQREPDRAVYVANEGSRTSRIVKALAGATFDDAKMAARRDELLELWEDSKLINRGQVAARAAARQKIRGARDPGANPDLESLRVEMPLPGRTDRAAAPPNVYHIHLHLGNGAA